MAKAKIKIYSTPTCVYCKMAKEFFKKNKVKYEEYDVSKNLKAQEEMVEKSKQLGVPVIEIGREIIIGFDKPKIEQLLKAKSQKPKPKSRKPKRPKTKRLKIKRPKTQNPKPKTHK